MVKKVTSLILVIFLLCTLLAGCQSDDKEKENSSEKIDLGAAPVTIVVYTTYMSNEYLNKVRDLEEKIRDTLNINFDVRFVPNAETDSEAAVKKFLQSSQEFDLLFADASANNLGLDETYNNAELLAMGYFMDITDLLPLYAPNYYSRFSSEDLQAISYNGRIYNIPELSFESKRPCVLVWERLLEKYKIKEINRFEDYENYMKLIKEKENDDYTGSYFNAYGAQPFIEISGYVMLWGNIVYRRDDPGMKLIPWEQTDAFKEAVTTLKRWWDKGYDRFSSGKPEEKTEGSYITNLVPFKLSKKFGKSIRDPGDEWVLYQLYPDVMVSRNLPDRKVFISKNSKNAERILQFIEWTNASQGNYDLGIIMGPYNFYYEQYDDSYRYYFEKEEYVDMITRSSEYPPHLGYTPPARFMEKIAERCDDIKAFYLKCDYRDEAVEEFIRQQKEKGIDNLVKELQEDLDAWRRKQSST